MLPIEVVFHKIYKNIQIHPTLLLQAPPGAGKSTWLPLQLLRSNTFKKIIMLEPRRMAARNIALFLAGQQNEKLGKSIGLKVKNEVFVSQDTRLEIVTEGVLTSMLLEDPQLKGIDLVIFDEFHERSLSADTALAFTLESQEVLREDLKILVMSATLDSERYQSFLKCPLITAQGHSHPVDIKYFPIKNNTDWLATVPNTIKHALNKHSGGMLVFLPGIKEINFVHQALMNLPKDIDITPLFGEQDKSQQQAAIMPADAGRRKVVLTTNIAETSLTIEGIKIVIDSGKKKVSLLNIKNGIEELKTISISQSSAIQRAGRAGRLEPGVVYRLGTMQQFERKEKHEQPDILTSDITTLLLNIKHWGSSLDGLPLLDKPSEQQKKYALSLLSLLKIIDKNHNLTCVGKKASTLPTSPRLAKMLIESITLESKFEGISVLACYIVAFFESRIRSIPELRVALDSMHDNPTPTFKNNLNRWLKKLNLRPIHHINTNNLPILLALAFPDRLAKTRGTGYLLANGTGVNAHQDYWQASKFLAIADLGGNQGMQIFNATEFEPEQLRQAIPDLFTQKTVCEFDLKHKRFIHEDRLSIGALTIKSFPSKSELDNTIRANAWLSLIKKEGLTIFNEYSQVHMLLAKLELAHKFYPQSFDLINSESLLQTIDEWCLPYLIHIKNFEELKKLYLRECVNSLLTWEQKKLLEKYLPSKITVPSGSNIKVVYQHKGPAKLSVKIQEVYGLTETPNLCEGKLALVMELLSPAQRPIQLTQDLKSFWNSSYREVQKEMKGRYPKHFWPDNPANAKATTKVKSKM